MRTWTTGEVVTAAELNSNIRDALNFLLAPPLAVLRQTVAQSTANSAWTAISFDTEDFDRDGGHSTSTNASRYVAQTTGWYLVVGSCGWASNTTGIRAFGIVQNGDLNNSMYGRVQIAPATGTFGTSVSSMAFLYLNAGTDYVEIYMFQNSGAALNTGVAGVDAPRMQVVWLSS